METYARPPTSQQPYKPRSPNSIHLLVRKPSLGHHVLPHTRLGYTAPRGRAMWGGMNGSNSETK